MTKAKFGFVAGTSLKMVKKYIQKRAKYSVFGHIRKANSELKGDLRVSFFYAYLDNLMVQTRGGYYDLPPRCPLSIVQTNK